MVNTEGARGASMGIDLGSKYSRVGVWRNDRVEIVPSKSGDRSTPTIVAFAETEVLIGESATLQLLQNAENTIFDITRLVGRKFSDPDIQEGIKYWPFKVTCGPDDKPLVVVTFEGESRSFQPVEILAMFLSELREMAESSTGEKLTDAVVTMPLHFNQSQRQAIKNAGAIAGLNVVRLISGATTASIGCGLERTDHHTVLVFDMGGSTLDLSLMTIVDSIYEVRATLGVPHLGGDEFTARLLEHCAAEFKRTHGKDLRTNARAMVRLRSACEQAKRTLSTSTEAQIELASLYEGIDLNSTISRPRFNDLCADLFDKVLGAVSKVLLDATKPKTRVDEIVVVGGSSRIPRMQQLLEDFFNGKKVKGPISDESAAIGAAMQAAILTGDDASPKLEDLLLLDVLTQSLQMEVNGIKTVVVPRNCTMPTKKWHTISAAPDSNSALRFRVLEGEEEEEGSESLQLGMLDMDGLSSGESKFEVTIDIDANLFWIASVVDTSTGKEKKVDGMHWKHSQITTFVRLLRDGEDKEKEEAAEKLGNLAASDTDTRGLLVDAGVLLPLVALIHIGNDRPKAAAVLALCKLAVDDALRQWIALSGAIPPLVALLENGNDVLKENASAALSNLSANDTNKERIAVAGGILPLVALIRGGNTEQQKNAAEALQNVGLVSANREKVSEAGVIPLMTALVRGGTELEKEKASRVLWNLVTGKPVSRTENLIEGLTKIIYSGSRIIRERAVQVLCFLGEYLDRGTKAQVAINGGIDTVLSYIRASESSKVTHEGLAALEALCLDCGVTVRSEFERAGGISTLVNLSKSGDEIVATSANRVLTWVNGSFDELTLLCGRMGEAGPLCRHVLDRLKEISPQGVSSTTILRVRFVAILSTYVGKPMVLRLVGANSLATALAQFHKEIDSFLQSEEVGDAWQSQWEADREAMKQQLFECEIGELVSDLVDSSAQMEALTLLVHEVKEATSYSQQEKEFLRAVIHHIVGFSKLAIPSEEAWFIARHEVIMEDTSFNRGSFGQIYHGTYMNAPVVVKCVDISSEASKTDFMREVSVWQKANRHPNIVPLYGACHVGEPCFMVCKHIAGGSLSVYLRRQKGDRQSKAWRVLLDVTHGLQFLHSRGIIHGDLKGSNVLVDGDTAMLTDFGMSCFGTGSTPQFDNLGAIRWRAPEFVAKGKSSFEADVYSLGMVVVEAVAGMLPWGMAPEASVQWHLKHGKFMKKPEVMSDEMWGLVCAMCDFDPSKRLKLEDVEKQIKKLAEEEEDAFRLRGSTPLPTSKSSPVAVLTA